MPTVCKLTLDAEEYRRELAAVVAESRSQGTELEEVFSGSTGGDVAINVDTNAAETAADDAEMVCCQTGRRPEAVHFLRDVCKNVSAAIFGTEKRQTGFQIIQMYQMLLLSGILS